MARNEPPAGAWSTTLTFFEESSWQPSQSLSAAQVAHYRDVLITHANDPGNRKCRVCHLTGCAD